MYYGKRPLGRWRRRWEGNIRMFLKGLRCEDGRLVRTGSRSYGVQTLALVVYILRVVVLGR